MSSSSERDRPAWRRHCACYSSMQTCLSSSSRRGRKSALIFCRENVFEPTGLDELIPDWAEKGAPVRTAVSGDDVHYLTSATGGMRVPGPFVPRPMHNKGNYIISLGRLCQWLGEQAEHAGVNVFPGFAASEVLYDADGRVTGVATSDMGIGKDGEKKSSYQAGYELLGKYTIFAEGVRGNLSEQIIANYDLRVDADPQHYGLGIKEVWDIDPKKHSEGLVVHTLGWPLDAHTEGGRVFVPCRQ